MARETIYENPNVAFSGGEGMVTNLLLIPNTTYQIVWDDDEYTSTATEAPFNGMTVVAIGDLGIALGAPTGEYPFLIGALPDGSAGYAFTVEHETPSHSIAIYREVEVSGTGIVLKDRDGNPVTHYPTGGIRLPMSDGSTKRFINADDVPVPESVTIVPNFSTGDMLISPKEGKVFSNVTVTVPEGLEPQYIPEGMYIAGVGPGEFNGGGGNVKVAWGILPKPKSDSTNHTFTHNLGVLPDVILIDTISRPSSPSTSYAHNIVAYANAFGAVLGTTNYQRLLKGYSTSGSQLSRSYQASNFGITWPAANTAGIVCMANETSFTVVGLDAESAYFWVAIGGLT